MRMKIDEFTTNYFVCNFTEQEYLDMLTGVMPSETEKKIIDAFIRYLRDRKKISLPVLKGMITKFNRVLYDNAMRSVESYLFFDKNDEEAVKNYVKKLTFDDYADIVSDCLFRMKNRHIGKHSLMLKKKYHNMREMIFIRMNRAITEMICNVQYVKDADTVFKNAFTGRILKIAIINLTRRMIYTVLYDRGMNSSKSKSDDPKNPEFVKLDVGRMSDYVYTTELKNLPYNIESLLNAASTIFDMLINMELRGDPPTFVTTTEKNFYKMTEGLSDEIIKQARLDAGIEIVGKLPVDASPANETTADACQPARSAETICDRTFSTSHFRDKISIEEDEKNEITIDSDEE